MSCKNHIAIKLLANVGKAVQFLKFCKGSSILRRELIYFVLFLVSNLRASRCML